LIQLKNSILLIKQAANKKALPFTGRAFTISLMVGGIRAAAK
jgi:hypothetical protein